MRGDDLARQVVQARALEIHALVGRHDALLLLELGEFRLRLLEVALEFLERLLERLGVLLRRANLELVDGVEIGARERVGHGGGEFGIRRRVGDAYHAAVAVGLDREVAQQAIGDPVARTHRGGALFVVVDQQGSQLANRVHQ
ncbi:hypothetical protein D3C83_14480 [compost metagenome]